MADQCINFLKSEQMKKELKDIIKPILEYLFKELSIYLFFFIFFIFTSFLLHLGILVLLIRYNNNINK
tara:strand:+ start:9640 stop:9843 length:204 start_codon:yes stop_codon:yes gene_type:complete